MRDRICLRIDDLYDIKNIVIRESDFFMLRMRLRRVGSKNQPSYRVVVADQRAARDGAFVDYLGHYNPRTDPPTIVIDEEKALKWLRQGAQPSEAVHHMLKKMGTLEKVKEQ